MVMMVHFPYTSQPGHPWFCLIQALLMLLLDQTGSAIPLSWLGTLAPPRLILVVWVVSLVLQPQPLGLLNEGTLLAFREKSEENNYYLIIEGPFTHWLYNICSFQNGYIMYFLQIPNRKSLFSERYFVYLCFQLPHFLFHNLI